MKRNILLILIGILLFPITTYALSGSVVITCSKNKVNVGDEITCTITGNTDAEVSALHGSISVSENLEIVSVSKDAAWEGSDNTVVIDYYTDTNKNNNFAIATVRIKALTEGASTVNFNEAYFVNNIFEKNTVSNSIAKIQIGNKQTNTDEPTDNVKTGLYIPLALIGLVLVVSPLIIKNTKLKKKFFNI